MPEPDTLEQLHEQLDAIRTYPDPRRASVEWKQVYRLLGKTSLAPRSYQGIVGMRDVSALEGLLKQLACPSSNPGQDIPDPATLKRALQMFRKRAKLTRLDDESSLGRSPLTKGSNDALSAITPPAEFPSAVWEELVRQGKLRSIGHGLYELA